MTRPHDDQERELVDLVCRLDESLDSGGDSRAFLDDSSSQLNPAQLEELRQAGAALEALKRVRRNLTVLRQLDQQSSVDESVRIAGDSTIDLARVKKKAGAGSDLPHTLGRFEILDVLGQGAFNRVFLARDPQLDRLVALKVPRPGALVRDADRRRFAREAQAAAVLSHPAIVPIFETGSTGPISYIAFGYCDGETLADWMARHRGNVKPGVAAAIVVELAEAVEHAHQRGVIHRDLKPANILLETSLDSGGHEGSHQDDESIAACVRITDFGLAKYQPIEDDTLTVEGAVIGTPAYMSPEQARGEKSITGAADIYALGTIFYEILTGERPFKRESHLLTLRAVESQLPAAPRRLRTDVPRDLEAICLKCLAKHPQQRYSSAHELAADLRRWQNGMPIKARPITTLEKVSAWAKRNPGVAAALSLAFVSLTVGFGIAMWQRQVALTNLRESVRQSQRASAHLVTAQDVINEIIKLDSKLRHSTEFGELRMQLIGRAAELQSELMDRETESDLVKYKGAIALSNLSPVLIELGQEEVAIENAHQAIGILDEIAAIDPVPEGVNPLRLFLTRQGVRMNLVDLYSEKGDSETALALINANLTEEYPSELGAFQAEVIRAENHRSKANAYVRTGDKSAALRSFREGLRCMEEVQRPSDKRGRWDYALMTSRFHAAIGSQLQALGQLEEAESQLAAASEEIDRLFEIFPDSPYAMEMAAAIAITLADVERAQGEVESALDRLRTGRTWYRQLCQAMPDKFTYAEAAVSAGVKTIEILNEDKQYGAALTEATSISELHSGLSEVLQDEPKIVELMSRLNAQTAIAKSRQKD